MGFKHGSWVLVRQMLSVLFMVSTYASANETALQSGNLQRFELRPINCIAEYIGQECRLEVEVIWQLKSADNICLKQDEDNLKCWQAQAMVRERLLVSLKENTTFQLVSTTDNLVLKEQKVTINFLNKYRRRLKPQWSIF